MRITTYNDAVVTLCGLNLELILQKETSRGHRGSKAAKDLQTILLFRKLL